MRFFEIAYSIRDLRLEQLIEWAKERSKLNESKDFSTEVSEYKNFIKNYIVNINDTEIGEEYYPVMLYTRPSAKIIEIQVPRHSVKLVNIDQLGDFDFLINEKIVKFPKNYEDNDEQLPYFMTTTLFINTREVNQFFTFVSLQFAGRWTITKKEIE